MLSLAGIKDPTATLADPAKEKDAELTSGVSADTLKEQFLTLLPTIRGLPSVKHSGISTQQNKMKL